MKKILLLAAPAILLLIPSCTREGIQPDALPDTSEGSSGTELYAVYAPLASESTRTSYSNAASDNFSWDDGDQIAVLTTDYNILTGTSIGTLTGTLTPYTDRTRAKVTLSGEGTRDKIAFYPENMFWSYVDDGSSSIIRFKLHDSYDLTDKGEEWSPIPMFAWNDPNSNNLNFVHLCSLFRIICNNVPVGTQYIRVSSGGNIAGILGMRVSPTYSERYLPGFDEVGHEVTYKVSDSPLNTEKSGIVFNLPIPASSSESVYYDDLQVSALNDSNEPISGSVQLLTGGIRPLPGNGYTYTVNFPQ